MKIAPLKEAGIQMLHIGVTPAPRYRTFPLFCRWRDPAGNELILVYQQGYGTESLLPDTIWTNSSKPVRPLLSVCPKNNGKNSMIISTVPLPVCRLLYKKKPGNTAYAVTNMAMHFHRTWNKEYAALAYPFVKTAATF